MSSDSPRSMSLSPRFLIRELAIVVIGVLIALGADSWWDGRQERARAREYVEALEAEVAESRRLLERRLAAARTWKASADSLGAALADSTSPSTADVVRAFGWPGTPSLPMGTVEALIETGDLRLLRPELRLALLRERSQRAVRRSALDRLFALASQNVRDFTLAREEVAPGAPGAGLPVAAGRRSPEVRALVRLQRGLFDDLILLLEEASASVDSLGMVVGAES